MAAEALATGAASSGIIDIDKCAWKVIKPHMGYLFFYRAKVKELKRQVEDMAPTRDTVLTLVETAQRKGDTIHALSQAWQEDFQRLEAGMNQMEDKVAGVRRFCWDLRAAYRLGKRASQEVANVPDLRERGTNLITHGVSIPPPPPPTDSLLPNDGFQAFETTTSCMERVMEELKRESVNLIAVHGMGGIGKTSLIKEVIKKAKSAKLFDEAVFAVVSKDQSVTKIQQQIAEQLDFDLKEETELVRAGKIRGKLMNKRTLVVLDDLWESLVPSEIGIPECCKVVITTQNANIGPIMSLSQAVNIQVGVLSEKEAWELFTLTVGDLTVAEAGVQTLVRDAARECGGLPLALTVLGKAMMLEKKKGSHRK